METKEQNEIASDFNSCNLLVCPVCPFRTSNKLEFTQHLAIHCNSNKIDQNEFTKAVMAALSNSKTLKEKFSSHPQVKRIAHHRQIPKHIYNAQAELRHIQEKSKQKYVLLSCLKIKSYLYIKAFIYFFFREENRRIYSKPGAVPYVQLL